MSKECIYDICWSGQCKKQTIDGQDFCEEHLHKGCEVKISQAKEEDWSISLTQNELSYILEKYFHNWTSEKKITQISIKTDFGDINLSNHSIEIEGKQILKTNVNCDHQAVGDCHDYAGSFVCGTPLCEEHKKTHKH